MKLNVIGGTGMIGSRIVAEAAQRGHSVAVGSRTGSSALDGHEALAIELGDTAALVALIEAADATVITVSPDRTGQSHQPLLDAHRALIAAQPQGRIVIVGGAGSLVVDGVQLKDMDGFPAAYKPEADTFSEVLALYRASTGLDWTLVSPAPLIAPGVRTGTYRAGTDAPVGDAISAEDFAVAILDELETPAHRGARFTVAN